MMSKPELTTSKLLELFPWRPLSWHQIFMRAAAMLSLVLLVSAYARLPGLNVFGHDEVHYFPKWDFKLIEEGRWVNFLLHNLLRSIPPGTWAVVFLMSAWTLFYRLNRSLQFEVPYSVLVTSAILITSPYVEQSIWPATDMPAVAILLFIGILAERKVPYPFLYVSSGVLLFGSLQIFYFLVPLLFLGNFLNSSENGKQLWKNLVMHLGWWVLGSILGTLVVFFILWLKTGYFGIHLAEWRHAQPPHDIASLVRNIEHVTKQFWGQIVLLLHHANVYSFWFITCLGLIAICRFRALIERPQAYLLIIAVAAGFFLFSIPLAPIIGQRNLPALGAAFVLLVACLPGSTSLGRAIGAVLLLMVCHGFSMYGESFLARHRAETNLFFYKFQQLMPQAPGNYSAVALFGEMANKIPEAYIFNQPPRMYGVFHALGVKNYLDCRWVNKRCDNLVTGNPLSILPFGDGQLLFSVTANNIAVVRFQEL